MEKLIKRQIQLEVRSINEEERTADFVISTEAVDTYGTVFKVEGADMSRYEKNNLFTYQHEDFSKDPDDVLGTSEVRKEDGKWIARAKFESLDEHMNSKAEKIWRKVKAGTLKMASIFARALEGSMGVSDLGEDPEVFYFRKWELYGWSIVTHGSNPEALKRSAAEEEFIQEQTKQEDQPSRAVLSDHYARYTKVKLKIK